MADWMKGGRVVRERDKDKDQARPSWMEGARPVYENAPDWTRGGRLIQKEEEPVTATAEPAASDTDKQALSALEERGQFSDAPIIGSETFSDAEIRAISEKFGVSPTWTREWIEWQGGIGPMADTLGEEAKRTGRTILGSLGNVALGLPQWAGKKLSTSEGKKGEDERAAIDYIREAVAKKRSYLQGVGEALALPGLGTAKSIAGGVGTGAKAARAAATGGAFGAATGLAESREGEEAISTLLGTGFGAVLGGGVGVVGGKLTTRKAAARTAREVEEAVPNLENAARDGLRKRVDYYGNAARHIAAGPESGADYVRVAREADSETVSRMIRARYGKKAGETIDNDEVAAEVGEMLADTELLSFAQFLRHRKGGYRNVKSARKVVDEYASEQGNEFLGRQFSRYAKQKEALRYITEEKLASEGHAGWFRRMLSDPQFYYRGVDRRNGTELMPTLNHMSRQYNFYQAATTGKLDRTEKLLKSMKRSGLDNDTLYRYLDGEIGEEALGGDAQRKVARAWRKHFDDLAEHARASGLPLRSRENYVPYRTVSAPKVQAILGTRYTDLQKKYPGLRKLDGKDFEKAIDSDVSLGELVESIEYISRIKITDGPLLAREMTKLASSGSLSRSLATRATAVLQRGEDKLPSLIAERNVGSLTQGWIQNTFRHAYLRDSVADMRSQIRVLEALGDENAAAYVRKHVSDIAGREEGEFSSMFNSVNAAWKRQAYTAAEKAQSESARKFYETAAVAPDILRAAMYQIYPNFLGLNPRVVLRNYTQPFMLTSPEIGGAYGQGLAMKAWGRMVRDRVRGVNLEETLAKEGWVPPAFRGEALDALADGIQSTSLYRMSAKTVREYSRLAMYFYGKSDIINRYVTRDMAQSLVRDAGLGGARAQKFMQSLPSGYRARIARARNEKEVAEQVSDYLQSTTQFNYNKLSMSEFGRTMGPLFSMFSKWPTSIAGDMMEIYAEKGVRGGTAKAGWKYLGPLAAAMLADYYAVPSSFRVQSWRERSEEAAVTDLNESDRVKKFLVGSGGFTSMTPVASLSSILTGDLGKPPAVEFLWNAGEAIISADERLATQFVADSINTFTPGAGAVRMLTDDLQTAMTGESPETNIFKRIAEDITD